MDLEERISSPGLGRVNRLDGVSLQGSLGLLRLVCVVGEQKDGQVEVVLEWKL